MQKLEAAGAFDSNILHPGDVRDPESFKVRRGKVGGYREYLSAEDQQFAADAMTELDRAVRLHRLKRAGRLLSSAAAVSKSSTAIGTGRLQTDL